MISIKKNETTDSKPIKNQPRHWFPIAIIVLCVRLVISGASPLRTAHRSLALTFQTLPGFISYRAPSPTTIKRYCQKVGYYKLKYPKTIADDWMVIVDASIQMGAQKCLIFLGIRQVDLPLNRALTLEDLEILSLRIVSNLNAKFLTKELKALESAIGKILSVCCDQGADILRGVKDFQMSSPYTYLINDTAHKVANVLEETLENNTIWIKFREGVTQSRRKMQNSLVVGALPPSPRTKSRFMNVDALIKWAANMLLLLDGDISITEINIEELKKYLGWLLNFREEIYYWNRLISIGMAARELVRNEGIHSNSSEHFEFSIGPLKIGLREMQFADKISQFLLKQSRGLKLGERLIGSTEVLETLFGKLKYMEQEQTAFGFTSLVLAAVACVGVLDEKLISEAVQKVKVSDIDKWSKEEIGESIQSKRRGVRKLTKILEMGQKHSGSYRTKVVNF